MRVLIVIPAYNEAANLPAVIADVRAHAPDADVLVVDDGSDDGTPDVLAALGVASVRLHVRAGVGTAVRTGLGYARDRAYDAVVRIDGDGQHPAALIATLLEPIADGRADIVAGSRYANKRRPASVPFIRRLLHYALGRILSFLSHRLVTDPNTGLWAFGRHAIEVLAVHHPSGYPEPELILFVSRNGFRVLEVPVEMRERLGGATSLTLKRTLGAMVRLLVLLAGSPWRKAVSAHTSPTSDAG